jgi:hypothetical protein
MGTQDMTDFISNILVENYKFWVMPFKGLKK